MLVWKKNSSCIHVTNLASNIDVWQKSNALKIAEISSTSRGLENICNPTSKCGVANPVTPGITPVQINKIIEGFDILFSGRA
jgi:hypothetical protein